MEFDEAQSRRQFLQQSGIVLGGLSGISLPRTLQNPPGCPTPPFGPIDCSPPAGYQTAVPWKADPTLPMRTRYSAFDPAGTANLAKLQKAYAAARQLTQTNPNDPRGWMAQAHVHCWYCGGGQNGTQGPEIHGSWWFFAWHRCYLYFHERALASLIKDPTVALAYWNWDDTASTKNLGVPPAFYTGSLNDPLREATVTERMDVSYVAGLTPADSTLLDTTTVNWFGSDPGNTEPSNGGQLENGPHGVVHLWAGAANEPGLCVNPPYQGKPDMGVLATAAQDPVFFAHHGNIDRLWDVWLAYQAANNTGQVNPVWPTTKSWAFYNANLDGTGQWVTMSIAAVLNHEQTLRYRYAPPPSTVLAATAAATPGQQVPLGTTPVTQTIPVPANVRANVAAAQQATKQTPGHILNIELQLSSNQGAFVQVFGNLPTANAQTGAQHPAYLGFFAIVPKGGKDHQMTKHIVLDVTRKLPTMLHGAQSLAVTLVPKPGPRSGLGAAPPTMRISRIYLTPRT